MDNKIYGLIGICMKAGKVLSGSGQSLGKSIRTAVLITDKGLASALLKKLEPVL